jgi:tetratricopeptide (TPR) repeat protein
MKLIRMMLARNRIRRAQKRLAGQPSPRGYAALAQEFALLGMTREVQRTCEEGLALFPGSSELVSMNERARHMEREERMAELKRELAQAPRPALWREMCQVLIESGRLARAEEVAEEWKRQAPQDGEVQLTLAQVRLERFLSDRGREQGRAALEALDVALSVLPKDSRPWNLRLKFATKIGAWEEAKRCAGELLRLMPGDPLLEARFRAIEAQVDKSLTVERALIEVERTGRFADETNPEDRRENHGSDVRPILQRLAEEPEVQAAVYVRGSTALVRGAKGATAERHARGVRSIIAASRSAGRRLGLGNVLQMQLEGDFGTLAIAPGEMDAGAIWTTGHLAPQQERTLMGMAGLNADTQEDQP